MERLDGSLDEGEDWGLARALAFVGYGLVIASLFTVWLTGFAAWLLAFSLRKHPDLLARSHFRNQLRLIDLFGLLSAVGIALALWGGWTVIAPLFQGEDIVWTWRDLFQAGGLALLGAAVWLTATLLAIVGSIIGILRLATGALGVRP